MSDSVGRIDLELGINKKGFQKDVSGISSMAAKAGKVIAAAFAIDKLVSFSKACVQAYTTQAMSEKKLETVMSQRMKANSDMINSVKELASEQQKLGVVGDEVTLSGAQQLATFLNSTSALKKLLPAMDNLLVQQNGLNATAENAVNIGNLMGKVMQGQTSALTRVGITFSEAQENILKYGTEEQKAATLAEVITDNVGEMNKAVANTPLGQIQQLKNNWGDVCEVLGQTVTYALVPMLKTLNKIVEKLSVAATAAKDFVASFLGIDESSADNIGGVADSMSDAADSSDDTADNMADTTKQAKKLQSVLAGFDELNVLSFDTDEDEETETAETATATTSPSSNTAVDDKKLNKTADTVKAMLDTVKEKTKQVAQNFGEGFKVGLDSGNAEQNLESIKKECENIKKSLADIFGDSEVLNAAKNFADKVSYNLGSIVGACVSIGTSICDNLIGGVDKYLDQNKDFIKTKLINMFNIGAEISDVIASLCEALADIFTVFDTDAAKQLTADIIAMFVNPLLEVCEVCAKLGLDIWHSIADPIIENKDAIKENLASIIDSLDIIIAPLSDAMVGLVDSIYNMISPLVTGVIDNTMILLGMLGNGFTDFITTQAPAISEFLTDVITNFSNGFDSLGATFDTLFTSLSTSLEENREAIESTISGLLTSVTNIVETVGTIVGGAFETACKSIEEFVTNNAPAITQAFSNIEQVGTEVFGTVSKVVDDLFGGLKNWWEKDGERIFKGFCDALGDIMGWALKLWNDSLAPLIKNITDKFNVLWDKHLKPLWDNILALLTSVGDYLLTGWNKTLKPIVNYIVDVVGPQVANAFNFIGDVVGTVIGVISDVIGGLIKTLSGLLDFITGVFSGDWSKAWEGIKKMFKGVWDAFEGIVKGALNLVIDVINYFIRQLDKIKIDVPEGVPVIGGTKFGINIPEIPKFAKGGVINQPTLAMVGENGKEAVMPLENNTGWIDELAMKLATIMSVGKSTAQTQNQPIYIELDIGGTKFGKVCIDSINSQQRRAGKILLNV